MHQTGRTHVYELDGLGRQMPVTFGCLTVASLSLVGIPPLAGFISKWNIAGAALACGMKNLAIGGVGTPAAGSGAGAAPLAAVFVLLYSALMTGIYMLTVVVRAYLPARPGTAAAQAGAGHGGQGHIAERATDPGWMMLVPLLLFAAVILGLGLHSQPLLTFLLEIGGDAA